MKRWIPLGDELGNSGDPPLLSTLRREPISVPTDSYEDETTSNGGGSTLN